MSEPKALASIVDCWLVQRGDASIGGLRWNALDTWLRMEVAAGDKVSPFLLFSGWGKLPGCFRAWLGRGGLPVSFAVSPSVRCLWNPWPWRREIVDGLCEEGLCRKEDEGGTLSPLGSTWRWPQAIRSHRSCCLAGGANSQVAFARGWEGGGMPVPSPSCIAPLIRCLQSSWPWRTARSWLVSREGSSGTPLPLGSARRWPQAIRSHRSCCSAGGANSQVASMRGLGRRRAARSLLV